MPFPLPTPDLPDNQWQKPLFLTIAVHVCFVLFGLFAPRLLHFQSKIPEVYTVNLFSVEDIGQPAPAAPGKTVVPTPAPSPPQPEVEVKEKKITTSAKKRPAPEPPAAVEDTISLKPIKTKKKTDIDKVKMLREKLLAVNKEKQARESAEQARVDADKKAKSAVDSLKKAIMAGQQAAAGKSAAGGASSPSSSQSSAGAGNGASGEVLADDNLRRYLIAVNNQIQEHWVLPDLQNWKANIEAIVIIRVRRDGAIVETYFKKRSENLFFNQFVEKTLKQSTPLPPFPMGINQSEMEIGLKFRPGEVF